MTRNRRTVVEGGNEESSPNSPTGPLAWHLGVDIGGTFTDCVAIGGDGQIHHAKTLSTHEGSSDEGVLAGVELLGERAGSDSQALLSASTRFSHGTTIGTNLVVERAGARVALLATVGHGDVILMMRGNGRTAGLSPERVFNIHEASKPTPLVPRQRILEVQERIDVRGDVIVPLDVNALRGPLEDLIVRENVEAVAVSLLWSIRNPAHELEIRDLVCEIRPDMHVSLSHEVASRQGEYERTVATVIDSYIGPASSVYLDRLADRLAAKGLPTSPLIMQANGGVTTIENAKRGAAATIGSGPTGGLIGASTIARNMGHPNVIATDMGGTSFDVGLVVDGEPVVASTAVIDQYRYAMPHIDVMSIACGGGSIARVDPHAGSLQVGPDSAGSFPGPACYGRGGQEPTVTDADVVLGFLHPDRFLDGGMPLDAEAARRAIARVAEPLGLSLEEAAAGIIQVNNHAAAVLIRQRTVEAGLDPRDFVIYAFGGAGPVHAYGYAAELGARSVVVPLGNGASTLSAVGIASSDETRYFEKECQLRTPLTPDDLSPVLESVERQARSEMPGNEVVLERYALVRYAEQYYNEIPLTIGEGVLTAESCARLEADFTDEYRRLYGDGAVAVFQDIEVFGVRVRASVATPELRFNASGSGTGPAEPYEHRDIFWPTTNQWDRTPAYTGEALAVGQRVDGPALVELPHTTCAVAPGQSMEIDASGTLILHFATEETE